MVGDDDFTVRGDGRAGYLIGNKGQLSGDGDVMRFFVKGRSFLPGRGTGLGGQRRGEIIRFRFVRWGSLGRGKV